LGDRLVDELTREDIRRWHADIARNAPFIRTKTNAKKRATKDVDLKDPEVTRRRQSTANRVLTVLKAGLNFAYDEGRVASNDAWGRSAKPFRSVDGARVRYLTTEEARRLVNACDDGFRELVRAALETGARYSELTRLVCSDFNADGGTVHIRRSKSGKQRHIVLSDDGVEFFQSVTVGRAGDVLMFQNVGRVKRSRERGDDKDPGDWRASEQRKLMVRAVTRAKIKPAISFHGLRHTWASLAVMNDVPLMVVAKNLGHKDTRMAEHHYSHLAPGFMADAIRAGAPRFGIKTATNVRALRRR
jgi:integrase